MRFWFNQAPAVNGRGEEMKAALGVCPRGRAGNKLVRCVSLRVAETAASTKGEVADGEKWLKGLRKGGHLTLASPRQKAESEAGGS